MEAVSFVIILDIEAIERRNRFSSSSANGSVQSWTVLTITSNSTPRHGEDHVQSANRWCCPTHILPIKTSAVPKHGGTRNCQISSRGSWHGLIVCTNTRKPAAGSHKTLRISPCPLRIGSRAMSQTRLTQAGNTPRSSSLNIVVPRTKKSPTAASWTGDTVCGIKVGWRDGI